MTWLVKVSLGGDAGDILAQHKQHPFQHLSWILQHCKNPFAVQFWIQQYLLYKDKKQFGMAQEKTCQQTMTLIRQHILKMWFIITGKSSLCHAMGDLIACNWD